MIRRLRLLAALLAVLLAQAAGAASLTITRTTTIVSDPQNNLNPRPVPGAIVDYTTTFRNPIINLGTSVNVLRFSVPVPAETALYVGDLSGVSGSGPVAISDGILGLLSSGLTYTFSGLGSTSDLFDFSSDGGASWTYVPVADSDGYDARVTNIRIRFGGNQTAGSAFSVRFRVRVK